MYPDIRTKGLFFRLWQAGVLGNKLRTWDSPENWESSGVLPVGFRQIGTSGGGRFAICNTASEVWVHAADWRADGLQFIVCEAAPDREATIHGEVQRDHRGLCGLVGPVKNGKRMRDSLRDGDLLPRQGLAYKAAVDSYMSPSSRDDLDALLELYPGHVVEFTCYRRNVGDQPGRNTIFWEVRNY